MTRRTRQIVASVLIPFALLLGLLSWGVASPPGASPDEDYHMGSIWCAAGPVDGRCEMGATEKERVLPADVVDAAACFAFDSGQSASCPLDESSLKSSTRGNWVDNGYPPVFYGAMSVFVTDDMSVSVVLMRSVNALLYVSMLTLLFFLLPLRLRPPLVWGALIGMIPLGVFIIPSVNPSAWAVLQATGLWLAVWGFFRQTDARKWGLAAMSVALMVMGAGARSDAAAYGVLAVLVGVVLGYRRDRRFLIELALPVVLIAIAASLFLTSGQSGVLTADTERTQSVFALLVTNVQQLPQLWIGAFGFWGLGWFDTPMPALVWVTSASLFAAVAFWGLRRMKWRKVLALGAVSLALVVVPLYILVREGILVGQGVQPRYIYPLLVMFAGVSLIGLRRLSLGLSRTQLAVVVIALAVTNSLALHTNMRRYITGLDSSAINLDRDAEWWWNSPLSPMVMWVVGSLAFAVAVIALAWVSAARDSAARAEAIAAL
ncbi:DUF2142 domain-containing protein [Microbacterium sp. GCS4]|uniref:DUF2142 domain-containing protein n=1 Tax=Microbacterium sp. GCS4 TaxID=1692239 RepID=UPI000680CE3C|nr:DUF2142 domain-containing protein [Microbacterium sp. GCS4]KNY07439.1 hypothetical protein AKH00_03970 [Microbacterium sp. GCS4]